MTVSFPLNSLHLIFLLSLSTLYPHTKSQTDIVDPFSPSPNCNTAVNYTHGTAYEQNLNITLSSLASNVSQSGFSSITVGQNQDMVYGHLQCRGGVSNQSCAACAKTTATKIRELCPNQKEASIVDLNCTLQYSYQPLSLVADNRIGILIFVNAHNASNPTIFYRQLENLLQGLTLNAASISSKLATGSIGYVGSQNIYAMAQCMKDSTESRCLTCLQQSTSLIPFCCDRKVGGRIISIDCNLRYETYEFVPSLTVPASLDSPPPEVAPSSAPQLPGRNLTSNETRNSSTSPPGNESTKKKFIVAIPVAVASVLILAIGGCLLWKNSKKERFDNVYLEDEERIDTLWINLSTLKLATRKFSEANKLGQGGFGSVYKGKLPDGREIAVKRLSSTSGQGLVELRTEVMLVAKLLHRNLVKLLGFCLEDEEKLLAYEYQPNGSLDKILFDQSKKSQLGWERRYKIIVGIARGLVYLHEDSQLRIIHRDLKASNILLDEDMNPKISDFGLARLFNASQTQANTNRIAGTYGYMAPEYIKSGNFSIKSDVYGFGILVLELLTGQRNFNLRLSTNLQSYAWHHWSNGIALKVMDPALGDEWPRDEALKCIHIGLLCVQDAAIDRPTMSEIVAMLSSHTVITPAPTRPAFFVPKEGLSDSMIEIPGASQSDQSMPGWQHQSVNDVTITELDAR